jgi:hypothetical protein
MTLSSEYDAIVWWSQLVTGPLWAQELSFELLLEIASRYIQRQQASFLPERVPGFCLPILAMSSQVYNLPFGMHLSFHNRLTIISADMTAIFEVAVPAVTSFNHDTNQERLQSQSKLC